MADEDVQQQDTLLFEDEYQGEGFTMLPNVILKDPEVSSGALRMYAMLLSYAWGKKRAFPGQDRLGDDLGASERTVRRLLDELESLGLIRIHQRGQKQTNVYYILSLSRRYGSDRTKMTAQDRTDLAGQDRTKMTAKEDEVEEDTGEEDSTVSLRETRDPEQVLSKVQERRKKRKEKKPSKVRQVVGEYFDPEFYKTADEVPIITGAGERQVVRVREPKPVEKWSATDLVTYFGKTIDPLGGFNRPALGKAVKTWMEENDEVTPLIVKEAIDVFSTEPAVNAQPEWKVFIAQRKRLLELALRKTRDVDLYERDKSYWVGD